MVGSWRLLLCLGLLQSALGNPWSWGHNRRGQLGLGDGLYLGDPRYPNEEPGCTDAVSKCNITRRSIMQPQDVGVPEPLADIDAGAYHNVAVTQSGVLWSWGWNGFGQLGTSENLPTYGMPQNPSDWTQRNRPTQVKGAPDIKFVKVAAGMYHSGAITYLGDLYMWGMNTEGQLCIDSIRNRHIPTEVQLPSGGGVWMALSLGQEHSVLLSSSNRVYVCGSNRVNQLAQPRAGEFVYRSMKPVLLGLYDIVKVSAGEFHTLALTRQGLVYVWGDNHYGQHALGPRQEIAAVDGISLVNFFNDPDKADVLVQPERPSEKHRAIDIAAGGFHNLVLLSIVNNLAQFGNGTIFELLEDHFRAPGTPPPEGDLWPKFIYGWGSNQYGQLGTAPRIHSEYLTRPHVLKKMENYRIMGLWTGNYHSAFITAPRREPAVCTLSLQYHSYRPKDFCDGFLVYTWGGNVDGELGRPIPGNTPSLGLYYDPAPHPVPGLIGRNITRISLGFRHSVAILGECPPTSVDACGTCFGVNSTCVGCDGIANSGKKHDQCGVCGGTNETCFGCDNVPLSGKTIDLCNVCGGDSTSCVDCAGTPNGVLQFDDCDICGGDGSTCQGCDKIPASGKTFDECEECDGDLSSCSLILLFMASASTSTPAWLPVLVSLLMVAVLIP